jgi:protein SCO1/2
MKHLLPALAGALALLAATPGAARDADPANSLYHLEATLTSQAGEHQGLDVYRDHPVLVSMFYGSCQATCPLIIDTLRATERALDPARRAPLRVLLISFDPERDSPAALQDIAVTRHIDTTRWTLAHADSATVRTIAALLNVQYRRLPSGEFNHSTRIALLSPQGEILASTSVLGHADPALLAKLGQSTK